MEGLSRQLNFKDAVAIGLGAMIGAGIFSAVGPAIGAAGPGVLLALLLAGAIAYANALSVAQLAAVFPESGGVYAYGRKQIGPFWGYMAGWVFVVGKLASCAAMALTFAHYLAPSFHKPLAILAIIALTAVNFRGVKKTAQITRIIIMTVLAALALAVLASLGGGGAQMQRLTDWSGVGPKDIFRAAGFLFFAFAGYARIATLGAEVEEPQDTIPRAIPWALGITLGVYFMVLLAVLLTVGSSKADASGTPLLLAVKSGRFQILGFVVQVGAIVGSLGVLLSLLAGVSRTVFAMALHGDMPRRWNAVHPVYQTPHKAEVAVAVLLVLIVAVFGLVAAISYSAFLILVYYAIGHFAALRLPEAVRKYPKWLSRAGIAGCLLVALALPPMVVVGGCFFLFLGAFLYVARRFI